MVRREGTLAGGAAMLAAAASVLLAPVSTASATGPPITVGSTGGALPGPGLTAALSSDVAGAQAVAMTLSFPASLRCGRPSGVVTVTLPDDVSVPARIAAGATTVNARPAGGVTVSGHIVRVLPPVVHGIMCHSVAIATEHLKFTSAAGLGNPASAGRYTVSVTRGHATMHGTFTIQ